MRPFIKLFALAFLVTASGVASSASGASSVARVRAAGCLNTPATDSEYFIGIIREIVSDTASWLRQHSGLPVISPDSVKWVDLVATCDTVMARYRASFAIQHGDSLPDTLQAAVLRVGPNRYVADAHVSIGNVTREWVTLDSTLTVIKLFNTRY